MRRFEISLSFVLKLLIWAAVAFVVVLGSGSSDLLQKWELGILDRWFEIRGELQPPPDIVFVTIDDSTARQYGGWPLPRRAYAELIHRLNGAGARVIVFDLPFYDRRDTTDASALVQATAEAGNVVHLFEFLAYEPPLEVRDGEIRRLPPPEYAIKLPTGWADRLCVADSVILPDAFFLPAFRSSGHATTIQDRDGRFRRIPLFMKMDGKAYPALALRALLEFYNVPAEAMRWRRGFWGSVLQIPVQEGSPIRLPLDGHGQVLLNFYGDFPVFESVPFHDVVPVDSGAKHTGRLSGWAPARFSNKIVIIAASLAGQEDCDPIPYSACFLGAGFHATMLGNALDGISLVEAPTLPNLLCIAFFWAIFIFAYWLVIRGREVPSGLRLLVLTAILIVFFNVLLYYVFAVYDIWLKALSINAAILLPFGSLVFADWVTEKKKRRKQQNRLEHLEKIIRMQNRKLRNERKRLANLREDLEYFKRQAEGLQRISTGLNHLTKLISEFKNRLPEAHVPARLPAPRSPVDASLLENLEQNISKLLASHETMFAEVEDLRAQREKMSESLEKKIKILRRKNRRMREILRRIRPVKNIGAFQKLVFRESGGYLCEIQIIGSRGATDYFHLQPRLITVLYFLALRKLSRQNDVWIRYDDAGEHTRAHFVRRTDQFLLAAKKGNYKNFKNANKRMHSTSQARKEKILAAWERTVLEAIENPVFLPQTISKIKSVAEQFGHPLIGSAQENPPYPLQVEEVEVIVD